MDVREKLVELLTEFYGCDPMYYDVDALAIAQHLIANGVTVQECARPLEEWHEDYGNVLWWKFPIEETPFVGSPLDEKWPGYHTHWTFIPIPQPPKGE